MRLIRSEGYPNQSKIGDYITIVSDETGGNVAYSATFNFNPNNGQHEEDVYYVRVFPGGQAPTPTPTPTASPSCYANAHSYSYCYANGDATANCYCYSHSYSYSTAYAYSKDRSYSKGATYSQTEAVSSV